MIKGIGCDIVKIDRLKEHQPQLAERILSVAEYELYSTYSKSRQLEFLAGRFAAKEALFKADNQFSKFSKVDIQLKDHKLIVNHNSSINLSISHEQDYVVAFCVITDDV